MDTTHFVCVWTGQKYGIEFVHKLHASILRNYSGSMSFTVLSDNCPWLQVSSEEQNAPMPRIIVVPPGITGYWNKLYLFARTGKQGLPHWPKGERIVYFDLDVLIRGSLDWLTQLSCSANYPLWMAQDSIWPECCNSSMMMWRAGSNYTAPIWEHWIAAGQPLARALPHSKGDQAWIEARAGEQGIPPARWQLQAPGHVVFYYSPRPNSKKWDTLDKPPAGTSVVVFHGKPHFDTLQHTIPWVKEHWRT